MGRRQYCFNPEGVALKNYQLILCLMAAVSSLSFAQGSLENPVAGRTESGIGAISGWHCSASNITATIDGASIGKAGSGTDRGDTASVCGRVDTGFSLLFNYNVLAPGSHSISVYADGQLLETRQFNTVQSGGAEFVTGLSKTVTIFDFPSSGKTATLQWSQAKQSFVVTEISDGGSGVADMSSLYGAYTQVINVSAFGSSCSIYGASSGSTTETFNVTTSGNTTRIMAYTSTSACDFNLTYVSGNSTSGFNLSGSGLCSSGLPASVSISNLIKDNNQLHGTITQSLPGCTQVLSL
jgi:hypothetical protein